MSARRFSAFGGSLALHLLLGVSTVWLASLVSPRAMATGEPVKAMAVVVVPPAENPGLAGLNPIDPAETDSIPRGGLESSTLSIPGFTFDFRKIAGRATTLFPFLTPGLSLESFALAPRAETAGIRNPFAAPAAPENAGIRRPPLVMSDAALQSLIDKSWSRRDRWQAFQRLVQLTDLYSADEGKLSAVIHAYVEQDGLQPFADPTIRDPRLWAELGLAADHVDFIGFISRYASTHPSTRTTTELLFLLDNLAQASFDALVTLLDVDANVDLQWTQETNHSAHQLIVDLQRHYRRQLQRKGLTSPAAVRTYFDGVRLAILTAIVRTTPNGYRASDARFLIGGVYWRRHDSAEALRAWSGMAVDATDRYAASCADILSAVGEAAARKQRIDPNHVDRILETEHGRWISFWATRLRQFGYHFDTF